MKKNAGSSFFHHLDAVYVDAKEEKQIVAIKPKPRFIPIFQLATTK